MKNVLLVFLLVAAFAHVLCKQQLPSRDGRDGPTKYDLDLLRLPQNAAVIVNSTVTLRCAVANPDNTHSIQWWEYVYSPLGALISDNENVGDHPHRERYSIVHGDDAEYSLMISPVLMSDGGRYQCRNSWSNPPNKYRHSMQLTVTDVAPTCTTTLSPDGISLEGHYHTSECTLGYQGGIIPNITWSGIGPFNFAYIATPTLAWSGMEFNVTRNMDGRRHISDTFYSGYFLPVDEDTADNVPTYTYSHEGRIMYVRWAPTSLRATPIKDFYEVDDRINCTADAYPPATYIWTNMRTQQQTAGSVIVVAEEWLGHEQTLRCEARNTIGGFIYSGNILIEVNVPIPTTTTTPSTTPPSTLPPAVARCGDVSGAWESTFPGRASLCMKLDLENGGYISGLARNSTDSWWVDVVGRAHSEDFDQLAFAGIQPLDFGVSSFVAECHRCFGVERLLAHVTTRRRGLECGSPGAVHHTDQYEFYRSTTLRCPDVGASRS